MQKIHTADTLVTRNSLLLPTKDSLKILMAVDIHRLMQLQILESILFVITNKMGFFSFIGLTQQSSRPAFGGRLTFVR